jgi:dTDP-4-dehydrorhamnose 3,5-epimerase
VKTTVTAISEVLIFEPAIYKDERGFFFESFNQKNFEDAAGLKVNFVQDNLSRSKRNVLRGLHYQIEMAQGKLISVVQGEVFDVAVDLRRGSPTFGKWSAVRLSAENKKQVWVPQGMAHGFLVVSETAEVLYKVTDYYAPQYERTLIWNDTSLAIEWPLDGTPILSTKDRQGLSLGETEVFA